MQRPLRFYGSKCRLAPAIIELLPPHTCYCEPFGGSAAVLLQKPPSTVEVYNDADGLLVNFLWIEAARFESDDPLELARMLYVVSWQSWAGAAGGRRRLSWRYDRRRPGHKPVIDVWRDTGGLWAVADRLRMVQLEHGDALTVIGRYNSPETVYYVDPPYPMETRSMGGRNGYRHELTPEDHVRLAQTLQEIDGMAIVSSYPSELYDELYAGWRRVERRIKTESHSTATEVLWVSPGCDAARGTMF